MGLPLTHEVCLFIEPPPPPKKKRISGTCWFPCKKWVHKHGYQNSKQADPHTPLRASSRRLNDSSSEALIRQNPQVLGVVVAVRLLVAPELQHVVLADRGGAHRQDAAQLRVVALGGVEQTPQVDLGAI